LAWDDGSHVVGSSCTGIFQKRTPLQRSSCGDDDAKDGGSDEGEVEELNIVLGDFSIQNNIDEQEDSNYEFQRMKSIGEFD